MAANMVSHQIKKFSEASREFGEHDWRRYMDRACLTLDDVSSIDQILPAPHSGPSDASAESSTRINFVPESRSHMG